MCPSAWRKVVPCSLSQLRKRELNYPHASGVIHCGAWRYYLLGHDLSGSYESKEHLHKVGFEHVTSSLVWYWSRLWLGKVLSLREAKSWPMPLATENCAKKVRVTPRTKNCIPSSSNLTKIINVLKISGRFSFWPRDSSGSDGRWIF